MVDFNIKHYLIEEVEVEKDPHRFDNFYGDLESKPETERLLFALQSEYLNNGRNRDVWAKMFEICWSYMQSLIKKRQTGGKFIEPDELDDKTTAATLAFMSQYLTKPEFEVGASFAGMMGWKIVEVMYKPSADDKAVSMSMEIDDDGKNTLEDLISAEDEGWYSPEDEALKTDPVEVINQVLEEMDAVVDDFYLRTIVRGYLTLCMKHPKNRHSKRMFLNRWATNPRAERLIEYVMLTIHNRLEEEMNY